MTIEELAEELDLSSLYLAKNFIKIRDRLEKEGTSIKKLGRGKEARYFIKMPDEEEYREYTLL